VRRAFAGVDLAALDPFVHMDQMGEIDYAPGEPKGTPWHPHRGFETVTYMIDGIFRHQIPRSTSKIPGPRGRDEALKVAHPSAERHVIVVPGTAQEMLRDAGHRRHLLEPRSTQAWLGHVGPDGGRWR